MHFRQQSNRQFNLDRPESAGRRLAAAPAHPTGFGICYGKYTRGRRLAAAAAHPTVFDFPNSEYADGRWLAAAATAPDFE